MNACDTLPLASYPRPRQDQVKAEMDAAPANAAWPGFLGDYGRLRDAVRGCQSVRP